MKPVASFTKQSISNSAVFYQKARNRLTFSSVGKDHAVYISQEADIDCPPWIDIEIGNGTTAVIHIRVLVAVDSQ
jgi:hypothetical protein